MQHNAMQQLIVATMGSLSLGKRRKSTSSGSHTPPSHQAHTRESGHSQHSDRLLMRAYPHHDFEAHQKSLEIQRRIKRNLFKGQHIDWKSIPAVADDDDGPHIGAFSGVPLSSCNTFEQILDDFRIPEPASAAGEEDIFDMIG